MSQDQYLNDDYQSSQDSVKSFVKNLSEKEPGDLSSIITHYLSYVPETVEAALIVSVDKGFISYDIKEKLWNQIDANFATHNKRVKNFDWENSNAFIPYVKPYSDEEIYSILEDPNEIVIDVYHAFLTMAKERELITGAEFKRYYDDAKLSEDGEAEYKRYDISDLFRNEEPVSDEPSESDIEAEKEKYWKCPKCHELVGMEFAECWNCAAVIPEVIEHPDTEEVLKEIPPVRKYTPLGIGIRLIGVGVFIIVLYFFRDYHYSRHLWINMISYVMGGIFVLLGIGFIIFAAYFNRKDT
jgi:hypothetical protein